jgi:DNA polymerase (family 10)
MAAASRDGVAMEINCLPDRLDLNDVNARMAASRGVKIVIGTDSHGQAGFSALRWGITVARRAWLEPGNVLNTLPLPQLRGELRRNRSRATAGGGPTAEKVGVINVERKT